MVGASFTKIKDGKFRVCFDYGGKTEDGKRNWKHKTVQTKDEAVRLVTEFNYNQQRGLTVKQIDMTLADHLQYWMAKYVSNNCEETTKYGYENIIENHIAPHLGKVMLQDVRPDMLQDYYQLLKEKGLSANTIRKHHQVLHKALNFALKMDRVYRNVADAVEVPKKVKFTGQSYTVQQVKDLIKSLNGETFTVAIYLALGLGLRRSEVCGLKWEHVDLENRLIHISKVRTATAANNNIIKDTKSLKSARTLHIPGKLYEVLLAQKEWQEKRKELLGSLYHDSGYVYTRDDGETYRVNTLSEQFPKFLEKHGLHKIRLHDLRHTFVSLVYAESKDLKAVSEAAGHADIKVTAEIYTHMMDKTHKETTDIMGRHLE